MKQTYTLTLVRSTKNKHVYSDGDILGAIYIPKSELPSPPPQKLGLTIETYED